MLERLNQFEKIVYYALVILLAIVIFISVVELVILMIDGLFVDHTFRLDNHEILTVFGFFLLILIGIELLDTIKAYIKKQEIHVEIIVLLAIIAVARKIILLDPYSDMPLSDLTLWGMGVVVICLAAAYYLIRKAGVSLQ
ncbi:MAG: Phosphate-starvation-inducible E [Methanoregulaceae archaeon PtaB.Bin108]|nr:MAG: Phosphate-starvation-inducible E [Methanoregulaceae archaeon PtaB.Bin108]OPY39704.1 MAG: Phosphate-starvation-inducible E [Methanoregulaceae archaeon PtaU1.Bin222]